LKPRLAKLNLIAEQGFTSFDKQNHVSVRIQMLKEPNLMLH